MTTRKSFPVYLSWAGPIEMLSIEEKAQLLDNLMLYYQGKQPKLNTPMLTMFWRSIEHFLKDSDTAYNNKVEGGKISIEVKPVQFINAYLPIVVTMFGISIEVNPSQKANVLLFIVVTPFGIIKEVNPEQPRKAFVPIVVTLLGIVNLLLPI